METIFNYIQKVIQDIYENRKKDLLTTFMAVSVFL